MDDISPHWKDSKWRSLKVNLSSFKVLFSSPDFLILSIHLFSVFFPYLQVQWDEPASVVRPDRVSPWEIEPFVASVPPSLSVPNGLKNKRPRQALDSSNPGNNDFQDVLLLNSTSTQLHDHGIIIN